jgi:lysine-N-methylase
VSKGEQATTTHLSFSPVFGSNVRVTLSFHALPIVEHWDCHGCTACCRETTIPLSADDLARLREQQWSERPEFRGAPIVRRTAWIAGATVLAQRADGACVFLTDAGRCRIHEEFGAEAKPRVCQLFPLQAVASDRGAVVTVRRSCPSAAADRGRPLAEHVGGLKRLLAAQFGGVAAPRRAPPIVRGVRRSWDEFHAVADALGRLLADARWPLVRRVVHGLRFCALLEECQWKRVDADAVGELATMLERSAPADVGELFAERRPPSPQAARLFRRLGAHFVRCVPGGPPMRGLRDQWRAGRMSGRVARACDALPVVHAKFPAARIEQLERPLGALGEDVLRPLSRFMEAHALSQQYALAEPKAPLTSSFYRLAFTYPVALWMLRWLAGDRAATAEDTVEIVVALERGYVLPALGSAAGMLARSGELERMVAWYGR